MPAPAVDLRSDTVTHPTRGMLEAMMSAEVGDDVLGDDPTVIALEHRFAALMGKPAACFVPSGTMANQVAIKAHTQPGDEIIVHGDSHICHYETGAPAALSGCMILPLSGERGMFDAADVHAAIRPDEWHYPASRLLIVENTHNRGGGAIWPRERFRAVTGAAREHGLAVHLDGARLMNACVGAGVEPTVYTQHVDTISMCFSKGLGAAAGSAVAGDERTIAKTRRYKKMFGGAMRQAGILAAGCAYALDHHVDRLADDHANARRLAEAIADMPGIAINLETVETNMVFFRVDPALGTADEFCARLDERGVRMLSIDPTSVRAVTHLDVSDGQVDEAIEILRDEVAAVR
jgi:threonine aldolase